MKELIEKVKGLAQQVISKIEDPETDFVNIYLIILGLFLANWFISPVMGVLSTVVIAGVGAWAIEKMVGGDGDGPAQE